MPAVRAQPGAVGSVHPILFHIGPLPVRAYGTLIMIGFLVALRYIMAAARRRAARDAESPEASQSAPITADHVLDMSLAGLVIGIIGTRVVFVALNWDLFRDNPLDALKIWTGGLSFIGGPLFGFAYAWWYCRRHRLSFRAVADIGSPGFALAYAFGRIGCFLNGCCYGHACSLPWAVRFEADGVPGALTPPSHPAQLYASAMSLVIFAVLHRMLRRAHRDGAVTLVYFILYATYRFINDFFRSGATSKTVVLGLTDGQAVALVAAPVLLALLFRLNSRAANPVTPPS